MSQEPLRRWGPIAAIFVIVLIIAGVILVGSGDKPSNKKTEVYLGDGNTTIELTGFNCEQLGEYHWKCEKAN